MPKLKVKITSAEKIENHNPIIKLEANHDFNIVKFMHIANDYNWELVATRKENHEKDVFDYVFNHLITLPKEKNKWSSPKLMLLSRFTINKEKKCVFLQLDDKKINVKCADEDKFDWKIGLGLAISKLRENPKFKANREFFRNNKTHKLDIKKYTNWILNEFYNNDMIDLQNLELRVKNAKDKEFIEL